MNRVQERILSANENVIASVRSLWFLILIVTLLGSRTMADGLKHHVTRHHQLDRAVQVAGRGGGDQAVCPGPKLASKAGAQKAGDDADVLWRHSKHLGQHIAVVTRDIKHIPMAGRLRRIQCEPVTTSHGNGIHRERGGASSHSEF